MADAVRQLLSSEGLADFLPALEQLGGTAMAYLSLLRSKDLLDIGMSAEQAAQLLSAVAAAVAPTVLAPPPPSSPPPARRPLRADDLSFELVTMLRRENAARLAPSTQAAYRAAEADGLEQVDGDWMEVTEQLQRACVREALSPAAPPHELARGLARLRGAPPWRSTAWTTRSQRSFRRGRSATSCCTAVSCCTRRCRRTALTTWARCVTASNGSAQALLRNEGGREGCCAYRAALADDVALGKKAEHTNLPSCRVRV